MKIPRLFLPVLALLAACSGPANQSQAQSADLPQPSRVAPSSAAAVRLSFAPVVKKSAPAVVNVFAKRLVRQQVDPFFLMFGGGVPRERVESSLGSGVIVRADGVIVTNNHVVEGGQEFMVILHDRREFPAKLLLADPRSDLAVLKIDVGAEKLPTLALADTNGQQVGDLVLAIGNPFGVGQTVTNGIISALNRTTEAGGDAASYIQTDAAINPGNSGGALVDMNGDLIGINSMILSRSGTSSGVGFAIPAPLVRRVVETAVGGGHALVRPWLGAKFDPVTGDIAKSLGLDRPNGALVTNVWPGGPAERAGLVTGDVVVAVGGAEVVDPAGVNYEVATHRAGDSVPVVVLRRNVRHTLQAKVEAPPATPARDERAIIGRNPLTGAAVVNLSPATADSLGLDPFARGVLVVNSGRDVAARLGFRPGDIIRAVNGRKVESTQQLQALLNGAQGGWQVTLERGGQITTIQIGA